ncbi:hypothetical protein PVL29_007788 [Vitis rotundifolia]|uniref:Myb-like domain-containing protein n=1 Tax=Vitis rotundifolia TaxID=103349 RepID=A0AA39A1L8_VITRO|nr:hypothetical protein PVL29_007788 [Vitis rotundifolia]
MDEDISRWILEFMIRKPIGDSLVSRLISILPLSNGHPRMKKTVLLRKIESEISDGSVSETILELLEIIEELDYKEGVAVLDSMKDAYCAVAVECTVKFLVGSGGKEGKYFDAVKRIWRGKIHKMENSATAGLVSDQLRKWRDDIEAAVWDARVCEDILAKNTRNDALRLVRAYVAEAWAIMGPPFLELAARTIKLVEGLPGAGNGSTCNQAAACSPNVATDLVVPDKDKETPKASVLPRRKHVGGHGRRSRGGVKITDTEEVRGQTSGSKYDCLLTPEVDKVQEALKSSSLELQALVKDPLPEALQLAAAVLSGMAKKDVNHGPLTKDQGIIDVAAPNPSVGKNLVADQTNEADSGHQCTTDQNNVPRPSLMARNGTARTFEWDDSIDASLEGLPSDTNICLPSPKRKAVSPLKKYEITKLAKRRQMKKWSILEEDTLRTGVLKFGKGNWTLILNCYRDIFEERTQVDLKDKWRNMTKY